MTRARGQPADGGDDGHDLGNPPPGCRPGPCVGCGGEKIVPVARMALGPIPGTDLGPGQVGTLLGWATCRVCHGRGWTWTGIASPDATPP